MRELRGIYTPIVSPFDKQGKLDTAAARKLVRYQMKAGGHGFYVAGGTGEGLLMTVDERKKLIEAVVDEVKGRVGVIAHIGAFQIGETLVLAEHATRAGVDAIAALPPGYFYQPDGPSQVKYYGAINEVTTVPLLVYNIPQRTGVKMTEDVFNQLLKMKNIIGMKDSSGDITQLGNFYAHCGNPVIFNGYDSLLAQAIMAGSCGGIGGTYNMMPEIVVSVWDACEANDLKAAGAAQQRMNEIINALRVAPDPFGCIKLVLQWMGLDCGEPRLPNRALTAEEAAVTRKAFEAAGFFNKK